MVDVWDSYTCSICCANISYSTWDSFIFLCCQTGNMPVWQYFLCRNRVCHGVSLPFSTLRNGSGSLLMSYIGSLRLHRQRRKGKSRKEYLNRWVCGFRNPKSDDWVTLLCPEDLVICKKSYEQAQKKSQKRMVNTDVRWAKTSRVY